MPENRITIAYVKADSEEGEDLYQSICKLFIENRHQIVLLNAKKTSIDKAQVMSYTAIVYSDLIIFDGSIDNNTSQYEYAYGPLAIVDYALIVSRTRLPYNFEGKIKGGAPGWIQFKEINEKYQNYSVVESLNNSQILDWIKEIVYNSDLVLPRKLKPKEYTEKELLNTYFAILEEQKLNKDTEHVFISFLSKESRYSLGRYKGSMEQIIIDHITKYIPNWQTKSIYLPPGQASREIMTEERRWELLSMIDRNMRTCSDVIIYKTKDYLSSWWTTGELIELSYWLYYKPEIFPTLYVVEPNKDKVLVTVLKERDEIRKFLPQLTEESLKAIRRRHITSDPMEAGYELLETRYQITQLPKSVKVLFGGLMSVIAHKSRTIEQIIKMMPEGEKKPSLFEMIRFGSEIFDSYTLTPDYWESIVYDCEECRSEYYKSHQNDAYSLDEFFNLNKPFTRKINVEDSRRINFFFRDNPDKEYTYELSCRHKLCMKKGGNYYRFLQPRGGRILNSEGELVKPFSTIEGHNVRS